MLMVHYKLWAYCCDVDMHANIAQIQGDLLELMNEDSPVSTKLNIIWLLMQMVVRLTPNQRIYL
jgi:hypothetical protein